MTGARSAITENPLLISRRANAPSSTTASTRPASRDWPITTELPIMRRLRLFPFDIEANMFKRQDRVPPVDAAQALIAGAQPPGGAPTI
jgi:hypothetical protein